MRPPVNPLQFDCPACGGELQASIRIALDDGKLLRNEPITAGTTACCYCGRKIEVIIGLTAWARPVTPKAIGG